MLDASARSLKSLFDHLDKKGVNIKGTILKPNMVTSGKDSEIQASIGEVAKRTLECLTENVPSDLPGKVFIWRLVRYLATAHLDAMNKIGGFSWKLSFSYGRALRCSIESMGWKARKCFHFSR